MNDSTMNHMLQNELITAKNRIAQLESKAQAALDASRAPALEAHDAELKAQFAAVMEKVNPMLKRAAAMLGMLADRDPKGRKTIEDFADEIHNFRLGLPTDYAAASAPEVKK